MQQLKATRPAVTVEVVLPSEAAAFEARGVFRVGTLVAVGEGGHQAALVDAHLPELVAFARMHTLDLSYCAGLTSVAALAHCTSLRYLDLSDCGKLRSIEGLGTCASLQTLNIRSCKALRTVDGLGMSTSLQCLDAESTPILNFNGLRGCMSLHTLSNSWGSGSNIEALSSCINLRDVDLSHHVVFTTGPVPVVGLSGLDFGGCGRLLRLNLSRNRLTDISDSAFHNCVALRTLDLSNNPLTGSKQFFAALTALETLDLCRTGMIDLSPLADCTHLQTLLLRSCRHLVSLQGLGVCPLQTLDLSADLYGQTQLSSLDGLASCTSLESLHLHGCQHLVDIAAIASCSSLRMLCIDGCSALTDLSACIHGCPALMKLQARGIMSDPSNAERRGALAVVTRVLRSRGGVVEAAKSKTKFIRQV